MCLFSLLPSIVPPFAFFIPSSSSSEPLNFDDNRRRRGPKKKMAPQSFVSFEILCCFLGYICLCLQWEWERKKEESQQKRRCPLALGEGEEKSSSSCFTSLSEQVDGRRRSLGRHLIKMWFTQLVMSSSSCAIPPNSLSPKSSLSQTQEVEVALVKKVSTILLAILTWRLFCPGRQWTRDE